jgi:hypothetical protein
MLLQVLPAFEGHILDEYLKEPVCISAEVDEQVLTYLVLMLNTPSKDYIANDEFLHNTLSLLNHSTYIELHILTYDQLLQLVSVTYILDMCVLFNAFMDYTIWRECFDKPDTSIVDDFHLKLKPYRKELIN